MQEQTPPFLKAFRGSFNGILRWPQLDQLWQTVLEQENKQWYIYAVGESPPTQPADREQLQRFIREIDQLLHKEHQEDYC